jgi:hypothetical protein
VGGCGKGFSANLAAASRFVSFPFTAYLEDVLVACRV